MDGGALVAAAALTTAHLGFAVLSVALAAIDLRTHRLPNRLVLPAYPAMLILLSVAALASGQWGPWWRALAGMAILFGAYVLVRAVAPGGIGGGDVKLAGLLGLLLAHHGWETLVTGAALGVVCGGVVAVVLLAAGRARARSRIAYGPWMLLGAWIAIILAPAGGGAQPLA